MELWETSKLLGPALTRDSVFFNRLRLEQDDGDPHTLPGGIRATRLMNGIHGIHGLMLGEGYRQISEKLTSYFILKPGSAETIDPVNFICFAYDWRRDNRISAWQLAALVKRKLQQWQQHTHNNDARVILIAHSMGGLVARYYLEVLEGWKDCRALITIGTPHRGSLKAVESLCDKHTLGRSDLTELVRTFPSIYQLLPIYPIVTSADEPHKLSQVRELPGLNGQQMKLVANGFAFHTEIRLAAEAHGQGTPYPIIPIVGHYQSTFQSVRIEHGTVQLSYNLPFDLPDGQEATWLGSGDGTVPYLSATPIEPPKVERKIRYAETHAWLPNNAKVLANLCQDLDEMQLADYMKKYQGGSYRDLPDVSPGLQLDMQNLYDADEPIPIHVRIINQTEDPGQLLLTLRSSETGTMIEKGFTRADDDWTCSVTGLAPGIYTAEVRPHHQGPLAPPAIHDILEVAR